MMDQLKQAWERLRSVKGFNTWLWIVILFVVLAIGLLINEPLPATPDEQGGGVFGSTGLALSVFFRWMAVIGFIYIAFLFFRKWQVNKSGPEKRRISVSERFHLSPKQTLILAKIDDREFLIGATDASIQMIAELDILEHEPPISGVSSQDFDTVLASRKNDVSGVQYD